MPRYYFQLRGSGPASQPERSRELPDLRAALAEAHGAACAMIRKQMGRARGDLRGSLDIEDETHQPVARILLADLARQIS